MKSILFLIITLMGVSSAFAAMPAGSGFTGMAGLTAGAGTMKNDDGTIPKCDMTYGEALLQTGYRFGSITPLAQASYHLAGQRTDPDDVSSINMGGQGYLLGVGLQFEMGAWSLSGIYNLLGKYDLKKSTSGGQDVSYEEPKGFHATLGYAWNGPWKFLVSFSQVKYEQRTTGSTEKDIKDNPLTKTLYGIGVGYVF